MTSRQSIESKDINISELLQGFYLVPDYQREYVWEDNEVEQLLGDIHTEYTSAPKPSDTEYFIGSIVVCPSTDVLLELIDGQQRLTTIYIFLCALRDHFQELQTEAIQTLTSQISFTSTDEDGNDLFRYRVELQYDDSGNILEVLAKGGGDLEAVTKSTRSIENIRNAYRVIRGFLNREFGDDVKELRRFYAFFTRQVKLVRIQTQSVAHALKIFETINDRGKGLDAMDLLKNLMFMRAKPTDFDKLKVKWKELSDTLYNAREKPLRFLRYFIFADYTVDGDRLREDEIYDWFVKNSSKCGYHSDPIGFVERLVAAADAYANFVQGKDATGASNRYLENLRYLSGAARQHLMLLLAARHLQPADFTELCRQVENLFFAYIITREATREFERRFAQWAPELRSVESVDTLKAFLEKRFLPAKQTLAARFNLSFKELKEDSLQKYRLRYLLGKLAQFVNEAAYGSSGAEADLGTFVGNKIEIEHILPQTPDDAALAEFDKPELAQEYVSWLGNLTVVEEAINRSIGNKPFSQKRAAYAKSKFLLTKTIGEKVSVGTNTAIDRAVKDFEPFDVWTSSSIETRQVVLTQLARSVWQMPERGAEGEAA